LLLNSSTDAIIKLSTDYKILEFNPGAEKFFGKKREKILNKNFIQLFIPEPIRKKTEKDMNKLLSKEQDGKFKTQVILAERKMPVVEWSVSKLLNNQKTITGMILVTNKIAKP